MTEPRPQQRVSSFVLTWALLFSALGTALLAMPASAHYCKSEDHDACASHSCPDDGRTHHHVHNVHWRRDHGCASRPTTGAAAEGAAVECSQSVDAGDGSFCVWNSGFAWDFPDFPDDGLPLESVDDGLDPFFQALTDSFPSMSAQSWENVQAVRVALQASDGASALEGGALADQWALSVALTG